MAAPAARPQRGLGASHPAPWGLLGCWAGCGVGFSSQLFLLNAPEEARSAEGRLLALSFPQRGRKRVFMLRHRSQGSGWARDAGIPGRWCVRMDPPVGHAQNSVGC